MATKVTDLNCSVNSNYVIARPRYWEAWRDLAEAYFAYVEAGSADLPDKAVAYYFGSPGPQLKVFIQERLPNWLLMSGDFLTITPDYLWKTPLKHWVTQVSRGIAVRPLFALAEWLKRRFRKTGNLVYIRLYSLIPPVLNLLQQSMRSVHRRITASRKRTR